jgi:hypothetical protein
MNAPKAIQQTPPHKSEREEDAWLDMVLLLQGFGHQGLGMPTVSGDTLVLPAACCVHA